MQGATILRFNLTEYFFYFLTRIYQCYTLNKPYFGNTFTFRTRELESLLFIICGIILKSTVYNVAGHNLQAWQVST